jgi:hypothetical protein
VYAWGNDLRPDGKWMANTFQGHFPVKDTGEDGFAAWCWLLDGQLFVSGIDCRL